MEDQWIFIVDRIYFIGLNRPSNGLELRNICQAKFIEKPFNRVYAALQDPGILLLDIGKRQL